MLKNISKVIYQPPSQSDRFIVQLDGHFARVQSSHGRTLVANLEPMGHAMQIRLNPFEAHDSAIEPTLVLLDFLFGHFRELKQVQLVGIEIPSKEGSASGFSRAQFYQSAFPWHRAGFTTTENLGETETGGRKHPRRPEVAAGTLYRRYVPSISKTISFRTLEIDRDLDLFHDWHNQPRVYDLWELNKSKDELRTYLEKGEKDPHILSLILEFDEVPAG